MGLKIQAFHKPNSNSGISNTITLLVVHLSELPLAVRITHRNTLHLFDVLVLDGGEEAIEEACDEMTRGLFCSNHEALAVLYYP